MDGQIDDGRKDGDRKKIEGEYRIKMKKMKLKSNEVEQETRATDGDRCKAEIETEFRAWSP